MAYKTEDIINALIECKGMIFIAAERLGCDPSTIHRRADKNNKIREAIENSRGRMIDEAEFGLNEALLKREPWAIQFALKNIGKGRGYTEKQEIEHSGNKDSPIKVENVDKLKSIVDKMSEENRKLFFDLIEQHNGTD